MNSRKVDKVSLFVHGSFVAHSGNTLPFKIDCDALTDEDLDCLAQHVATWYPHVNYWFGEIIGVPRGGLRFAEALKQHLNLTNEGKMKLIVDDVLTTGNSMEELRNQLYPKQHYGICGVVLFSRTKVYS